MMAEHKKGKNRNFLNSTTEVLNHLRGQDQPLSQPH